MVTERRNNKSETFYIINVFWFSVLILYLNSYEENRYATSAFIFAPFVAFLFETSCIRPGVAVAQFV